MSDSDSDDDNDDDDDDGSGGSDAALRLTQPPSIVLSSRRAVMRPFSCSPFLSIRILNIEGID
jgi:hypothetical protein